MEERKIYGLYSECAEARMLKSDAVTAAAAADEHVHRDVNISGHGPW